MRREEKRSRIGKIEGRETFSTEFRKFEFEAVEEREREREREERLTGFPPVLRRERGRGRENGQTRF